MCKAKHAVTLYRSVCITIECCLHLSKHSAFALCWTCVKLRNVVPDAVQCNSKVARSTQSMKDGFAFIQCSIAHTTPSVGRKDMLAMT